MGPRKCRRAAAAALGACLLAFSFGCTAARRAPSFARPEGSALVRSVPFYPQLDYQCGPASLAGLLNHRGDTVSPEEIRAAIFRKDIRGTVSLDMVLFARERGFPARFYRGSVEDTTAAIDAGAPLVVLVDLGIGPVSTGHYMVVVGYNKEGVIVNSGREREKLMAWESFLSAWERADRWTLRVDPRPSPKGAE